MDCKVYELNYLKEYKFVVILARFNGKWLLCRHKERDTWETAGGHIEDNETIIEAAKRELHEETGAALFDIVPVFDYWASNANTGANGMVFFANIKELGEMPESEMETVRAFDRLPENLTYNWIAPKLFAHIEENFKHLL